MGHVANPTMSMPSRLAICCRAHLSMPNRISGCHLNGSIASQCEVPFCTIACMHARIVSLHQFSALAHVCAVGHNQFADPGFGNTVRESYLQNAFVPFSSIIQLSLSLPEDLAIM